jgi:CelD/BcsL family acetyltransferase involved in cellulose biosynthesis
MKLTVEAVTERCEITAREPEWSGFVADSPAAGLFSTPEWVTSWLEAFWKDQPIEFLFAREGDRVVGVAPLVRDPTGRLRCHGALALPTDDVAWRGEIVQPCDESCAAVEAMLGHLAARGRFRLAFGRIAADSPTARALRGAAQRQGLWSVWRDDLVTPVIGLPASLDAFLESRSKHVRHELRRKQNRLEKAGTVELAIVSRREELDRAFDDVKAIEARSWKGNVGSSFLTDPGADGFYRSLFEKTVDRGWVRVYVMYFNGKPAAHLFGMVFKNRYYAFNCSFDTGLADYSPGAVVVLRAIEDACRQKLELFDFLGSQYRWKDELATAMQQHVCVCLFSHLLSPCCRCLVMDQHVKPFVRRRLPGLLRAKRAVLSWRRGKAAPAQRPAHA